MWKFFAVLSLFFAPVRPFAWDEFNIGRLFANSDEVFGGLRVESGERECVDQFKAIVDDAKSQQKWALNVMDTWAKEPAGLESGVGISFGHFDQCVELDERFSKQHCQFEVENRKRNQSYIMGICVPKSCSKATVTKVIRPFFDNVELTTNQSTVFQCQDGSHPPFEALQWCALVVCVALIAATVASTTYDLMGKQSAVLGAFSLRKNMNKLFENKTNFGSMNCLNGIRVISMMWILFLHNYQAFSLFQDLINPQDMADFQFTFKRTFIQHIDVAVDTFFMLGGLLLAYNFMKGYSKGVKFNYLKYVLHRYLRLIPVFGMLALLLLAFAPFVSDGPIEYRWSDSFVVHDCRNWWWSGLLLIQNYLNPLEMCIATTWYSAADFQMYVLSPLILFPLAKYGKRFFPVMLLLTLASISYIFTYSYMSDFHFMYGTAQYWVRMYWATHTRIGQWLIGMVVGYYLFKTENKEIQIKRSLNLSLWGASALVAVGIFVIPYLQYSNKTQAVLGYAFFTAFHRQIWCVAVGWVIFACVKGYGGPVTWFLSFPFYQPLAKLSFAIYLLHNLVIFNLISFQRSLVYFNEYLMIHFYLGILLLATLWAIPFVLTIEMPVANLEAGIYKLFGGSKNDKEQVKEVKKQENGA